MFKSTVIVMGYDLKVRKEACFVLETHDQTEGSDHYQTVYLTTAAVEKLIAVYNETAKHSDGRA